MSIRRLEKLASLANSTKGASFTLTRTKAKIWTIHFLNQPKYETIKGKRIYNGTVKFINLNLTGVIERAITWLELNRSKITKETYTHEL